MWNIPGEREYVVHCESNGDMLGPISKYHAHLPGVRTALCHYSTWAMIYNSGRDAWGIQRKSFDKPDILSAGKRDISVAGHNSFFQTGGETFGQTLKRESLEELGLDILVFEVCEDSSIHVATSDDIEDVGYIFETFHYQTEDNNEYVGLGLIITNKETFTYPDGEVIDFIWIERKNIKPYLENSEEITHSLKIALEKAESILSLYI